MSLNRALGRAKRAVRKPSADADIRKEAHQFPLVRAESGQGEIDGLRKQQNTRKIIPGGSKSRVRIKKKVPERG